MGGFPIWIQLSICTGSFIFFILHHLFWSQLKSIAEGKGNESPWWLGWLKSIPKKSICLGNATLFAIICGYGGWWVWEFPNGNQKMDPLHGENLFQETICLIGCGYFLYDLFIVIYIDPSFIYLLHAVLGGIFGWLGGVIPLASHAGAFVMAYEVSTPFKNVRYLFIKLGLTKSVYFRFIEVAFILSFFYLRVIIGLPAMIGVTSLFVNEIDRLNSIDSSSIHQNKWDLWIRLNGTRFLLYGGWLNVCMNLYWCWAIFKGILSFGQAARKIEYAPEDEDKILYANRMIPDEVGNRRQTKN